MMTAIGMTLKILPVMPGTKSRGRKATMLVRIEKVTGIAIWRAPAMLASRTEPPLERMW